MQIFEKIKIKLKDGKSELIKIFGIPVLQYDKIQVGNQSNIKYYIPTRPKKSKKNIVAYLKVNSIRNYTILNLQNWINIVEILGYDYYIICDNEKLKKIILKEIVFPSTDIKIIKSIRNFKLRKIANNLADKTWTNAALAHLTTFYHAKSLGVKAFWNIDADDTTMLVTSTRAAEILKTLEKYADKKDIKLFSLDMWTSYTGGTHWTFGVTYTDNQFDWFKYFKKVKDLKWMYKYRAKPTLINIDWFCTYLKDYESINIATYYIENLRFVHWDDFCCRRNYANLCYWLNGNIYYPILWDLFKDPKGKKTIAQNCIKFDLNISENECSQFYKNYIPTGKPNI